MVATSETAERSLRQRELQIALVVALVGLASGWVWAPAWPLVTAAAVVYATFSLRVNVAVNRWLFTLTAIVHAAAVMLFTQSVLLAGAVLLGVLPVIVLTTQFAIRRFGYSVQVLSIAAAVPPFALFAASWPDSWTDLAALPSLGLAMMMAIDCLRAVRRRSAHRTRVWSVRTGEPVPDFRLPARDGSSEFVLSEHRGRYVLLCFLRSDWCPICHVQMRMYQRESAHLAKHNVLLVAISPESGPGATTFADQMGVDFVLLADEGGAFARSLGIVQMNAPEGKAVPLPVSMLIDPDGRLHYITPPERIGEMVDAPRIVGWITGAQPAVSG